MNKYCNNDFYAFEFLTIFRIKIFYNIIGLENSYNFVYQLLCKYIFERVAQSDMEVPINTVQKKKEFIKEVHLTVVCNILLGEYFIYV